MFNLVNEYFVVFIIITLLLFGSTVFMRVKMAQKKSDKVLYNIYSIVTGLFLVLLILFKVI